MKTRVLIELPENAEQFKIVDHVKTFVGIYSASVVDARNIAVYFDSKKTSEEKIRKEVSLLSSKQSNGEKLKRVINA